MTDTANAPERDNMPDTIMAWPDFDGCITGAWSANQYSDERAREYVLSTHCDELVAAAYLDARDSIHDYPRVAPDADEANAYDEQIEHCQSIIDTLTPDDARTALTAYGERMKAEGAREAQAKIARLTEALEILRDNPAAVHINMLKGNVARPTWEQVKHLYCAEFKSLQENANG